MISNITEKRLIKLTSIPVLSADICRFFEEYSWPIVPGLSTFGRGFSLHKMFVLLFFFVSTSSSYGVLVQCFCFTSRTPVVFNFFINAAHFISYDIFHDKPIRVVCETRVLEIDVPGTRQLLDGWVIDIIFDAIVHYPVSVLIIYFYTTIHIYVYSIQICWLANANSLFIIYTTYIFSYLIITAKVMWL